MLDEAQQPETVLELIMRFSPLAIAISLAFATASSTVYGQLADDQIDPRSASLVAEGRAALSSGNAEMAQDLIETGIAVDPRNRDGYVALAEVALSQELPGLAIRYYREALEIEPNDLAALEGQGQVFVQRGSMDRAQRNLDRIEALCETSCEEATSLAATIAAGPPAPQLAAQEATTASDGESANTP